MQTTQIKKELRQVMQKWRADISSIMPDDLTEEQQQAFKVFVELRANQEGIKFLLKKIEEL